jgi:hypothetical protein
MAGRDFEMKRFSVPMGGKQEENKCWECIHHHSNGGAGLDGDICKECEKNDKFEEVASGREENS